VRDCNPLTEEPVSSQCTNKNNESDDDNSDMALQMLLNNFSDESDTNEEIVGTDFIVTHDYVAQCATGVK
jgi:hypothetical protein